MGITRPGGWSYPEGSEFLGDDIIFDWLHDFLKLYFARTIFRGNSSFSWWAAYLNDYSYKTVYYPAIYNMMKIFVSLSIHEGGPLPVLESMCCGAYPIVTNTGFAFDVIRPIVDGTLVDPFRSTDYYFSLIKQKFMSDSWDPNAMRERASLYSFKALASKILSLF